MPYQDNPLSAKNPLEIPVQTKCVRDGSGYQPVVKACVV